MTVNDIYGGSIGDILHKDIIAASLGKVSRINDLSLVKVNLLKIDCGCSSKYDDFIRTQYFLTDLFDQRQRENWKHYCYYKNAKPLNISLLFLSNFK